ncbi:MAG TPA: cyanophycin synthetase [Candidatus Limnocylindrales bacterium]|nr:cyanophycin synthetase [Candidatus Limnocylindrales bacterium]
MTRSAAEVGRGLAPARPARPILPGERIHVVGTAGAGASAALLLAHHARAAATGCDPGGPSPYTAVAETLGLDLAWGHDAAHVEQDGEVRVDRLAVTKALTAIDPDHPELAAARRHGVPVEAWQQVVADAAATHGGRLVGIAGTHGKSTSSGWLVHLLVEAGRDPGAFVGALLPAAATSGLPATARWGSGDTFVVEADEYAGNFDPYRPSVAVLLNAEWDHPDVFADESAVLDAFERWLRGAVGAEEPPWLVANIGDPGVARLAERLGDWPGRMLAVALVDAAPQRLGGYVRDLRDTYRTAAGRIEVLLGRAEPAGPGTRLELFGLDAPAPPRAELRLPGSHYAADALAVGGAAHLLGVPAEAIVVGLGSFRGVGRRLELKGEPRGVTVLDDYAHHPSAIAATLGAVRQRHPGRRVWAVYEPLTYHRTAAMLDTFAEVLATADRAVVADIWAGRDPDTTITSAAALAQAISARAGVPALATGSVESTATALATLVEPGDVVLVMGGGRSHVIASLLVAALEESG